MEYVNANFAKWGLAAADVAPAQNAKADWDAKLADHRATHMAARMARNLKDFSRNSKPGGLEPLLRELRRRIGAHPNCDDGDRKGLGMAIPGEGAAVPPQSVPLAIVDIGQRMEHIVRWVNGENGKRARPRNVKETEIRMAVTDQGAAPPPLDELVFEARVGRPPYRRRFASADIGRVAHYNLRWVHKDGTLGPWGETVSSTVPG